LIKAFGKAINHRHHRIAIGNRKCSAGTEIVLDVNNKQQIIVVGQDAFLNRSWWIALPWRPH
jgi:hypothetical protein